MIDWCKILKAFKLNISRFFVFCSCCCNRFTNEIYLDCSSPIVYRFGNYVTVTFSLITFTLYFSASFKVAVFQLSQQQQKINAYFLT